MLFSHFEKFVFFDFGTNIGISEWLHGISTSMMNFVVVVVVVDVDVVVVT